MKKSYLFLAPGFEEVEALATVDILRRAGMDVMTVAVTKDSTDCVAGAHGVPVVADMKIADLNDNDAEWLICPGGMPGASNLYADEKLRSLLTRQNERKGNIAAICASPAVVLYPLGLIDGRNATCYPGFESACSNAEMTGAPVVVDGNIITGNGPGNTFKFALAIVEATLGKDVADTVAEGMLLKA